MNGEGLLPDDFDGFFRVSYGPLVSALSVAVGPDNAADAVQEAFVQASVRWRKVSRYDRPEAWVRRVALNRLTDQQRKRANGRRAEGRFVVPRPPELEPADIDLARAVEALPERQRIAICLYYLLDLPVTEVAEAMSVTAGTVKTSLHDARRALAGRLEVTGDDEH